MLWRENTDLTRDVTNLPHSCDAGRNEKHRGGLNASAVAVRNECASKARKYRSHLLWMTEVRRRVAKPASDSTTDMVLSQVGGSIASAKRYKYKSNAATHSDASDTEAGCAAVVAAQGIE